MLAQQSRYSRTRSLLRIVWSTTLQVLAASKKFITMNSIRWATYSCLHREIWLPDLPMTLHYRCSLSNLRQQRLLLTSVAHWLKHSRDSVVIWPWSWDSLATRFKTSKLSVRTTPSSRSCIPRMSWTITERRRKIRSVEALLHTRRMKRHSTSSMTKKVPIRNRQTWTNETNFNVK